MKQIYLLIVLLYSSQYAFADITIKYKDLLSGKPAYGLEYSIRGNQLKFVETGSSRVNIFNAKNTSFISYDPQTGKRALFNEQILDQRVREFNQRRLKKLSAVEKDLEKHLKTMTEKEQEVGQSLINLLKYPDLYGKHTLLKITPMPQQKQIDNISCQSYQLHREKQLLKEYCLADASSLNMSTEEYRTLRRFYAFDYAMQTRLMLALGQTDFSLVDYDQQKMPGVIIETIRYKHDQPVQHLILDGFHKQPLKNTDFSLNIPKGTENP